MNSRIPSLLRALVLGAFASLAPFAAAQNIWIGAGGTPDWTDGTNWTNGVPPVAGEDIIFSGASNVVNNNDTTANTQYGNITFDPGSDPFVITGNAINIGANITNSEATNAQNLGTPLLFVANSTISVVSGGTLTLSGATSGSGITVTKNGNGVLNLSTGGSTLNATLQLNAGTISITGNGALAGGGTLIFGGGNLSVSGAGNQTNFNMQLTQNATISSSTAGNTNMVTGSGQTITTTSTTNVLTMNITGTSSISMGNSAQNVFSSYNGVLAFAPGTAGSIRFGTGGSGGTFGNTSMQVQFGAGSTTRLFARNSGATFNFGELSGTGGNISSNNGNLTVNIGALNTNSTYGGIFTQSTGNTIVNKNGTGVLTLSGANTHTGNTTVNAGTLIVTGSIASGNLNVAAGGTLSGTGSVPTILTNSTANGGIVSPGLGVSSIGTITGTAMTWGGSSDGTSATLLYDLGLIGNSSDSIVVSGALTKGTGTKWIFDFGNTGTLGNVYTLISYGSTTFTQADVTSGDLSFVNLSPGFINGSIIVGATSITLVSVPEPSTWALILGGAGLGLAVLRRRRAVR